MMEYYELLVNELNSYSGDIDSTERIKDLVCFISDDKNLVNQPIYQELVFEAAQKMRAFGYIKGPNKIEISDVIKNDLYKTSCNTLQNYYKSKVYSNNLLDKKQKEVINKFISMEQSRIILSAPTSFGKTYLLREILFLKKDKYKNIVLVFPTVALLNENTNSIKDFIKYKNLNYNIINNIYSEINIIENNIFILTPERTLKLLADYNELVIDFFFFDEVYKIDEDFNIDDTNVVNVTEMNENSDEKEKNSIKYNNRAIAFRVCLYLLSNIVKEFYIAGPYLNLNESKESLKKYIMLKNIQIVQINFEPTLKIIYDAWGKNSYINHPLYMRKKVELYNSELIMNTENKVKQVIDYIDRQQLGQAILYCSTPSNSMKYALAITESLNKITTNNTRAKLFIEHIKSRYSFKFDSEGVTYNSGTLWSFIKILEKGFGVHHGKLPKYIQREIMEMFNNGKIDYLFCTSTIIEGVNSSAKNVIIINNSIGNNKMTSFSIKNIKGRAGRYYHHFVGRIFYLDKKQRSIEATSDLSLGFSFYGNNPLSNSDIDNVELVDLTSVNIRKKVDRNSLLDKELLPDSVFVKNRLFDRLEQEKFMNHLISNEVFDTFSELLYNYNNIGYFIDNNVIIRILKSAEEVGILKKSTSAYFQGVILSYQNKGFKGLLGYQLGQLKGDLSKVDSAYLKAFDQIRTVIEFEVPRILSLFEALFKQVALLKGYDVMNFNLSFVIRYFELGVTSLVGIKLVEYGFPVDSIRLLERKFSTIKSLDLDAGIKYLNNISEELKSILDNYEMIILNEAIGI